MGNKIKEDSKRYFYPNEFDAMYKYLNRNGKFSAMAQLQTGARIAELRWFMEDPIFDEAEDRSNMILKRTKVRAKLGEKRSKPRILPLSKDYIKKLKRDIKKCRILSTNAMNIQLKKACEKANIFSIQETKHELIRSPEQFSSHNLRKTFVTWMFSLGVSPAKIAAHVGNSVPVLMDSYATNDNFSFKDKKRMIEIWQELPKSFFPDMRLFQ